MTLSKYIYLQNIKYYVLILFVKIEIIEKRNILTKFSKNELKLSELMLEFLERVVVWTAFVVVSLLIFVVVVVVGLVVLVTVAEVDWDEVDVSVFDEAVEEEILVVVSVELVDDCAVIILEFMNTFKTKIKQRLLNILNLKNLNESKSKWNYYYFCISKIYLIYEYVSNFIVQMNSIHIS